MSKTKHISDFVNDLLVVKADIVLHPMSAEETPHLGIKMAADSPETMTLSASRIGSLSDADNSMLVRIYKDNLDQCYRLYLLSSTSQSPVYAHLSIPGNPHFFIAIGDGQVEIPFSEGIDPLNTVFHLNYPLQIAELNCLPGDDQAWKSDEFKVQWDRSFSQLIIDVVQLDSDMMKRPTRLVFLSNPPEGAIIRLIPIRDSRAIIQLDGAVDYSNGFTICTYV
ncbi:hypothetical protein HQ531_14650 [bacterium]|nr:hypothetical protein [bacterium]